VVVIAVILPSALVDGAPARAQVPGVQHVVIVGVDGLSPDGIRTAETPVLDRLMKEGASTLHARGVMPTSSSPNWASMIMGAGPEQHGVTSNDWQPDKFDIAPVAVGRGGIFPTVFGILREQRPHARIACFHDWDGFGRLIERDTLDRLEDATGPEDAVERAVRYFEQSHPQLTFIHLDHVDHAGHKHGHGTPEYYRAVEEADRLIGLVIEALKRASMWDRTALLVTADHGGKGTKHGGATMQEIEIPWILRGPGVAAGKELTAPVNTYDTAATVAYLLGLKPPDCWIARPVRAAFVVSD
jgi:predicted AlkP superfamily pyrophosphatase or phosphodiesterase